jgi:hypothetical protein
MPGIPIASLPVQRPEEVRTTDGSGSHMSTRRAGTLVKTEEWWRDHYYAIERHGYKLRPRYHPPWEPSWIKSKKNFYEVEDGQASGVRSSHFLYIPLLNWCQKGESCDGRHSRTRWPPSYTQEGTSRNGLRTLDLPPILLCRTRRGWSEPLCNTFRCH